MRKEAMQSQTTAAAAAAQLAPVGFEPEAPVATSSAVSTSELTEKIRARAYELWIERGCRDGSDRCEGRQQHSCQHDDL